MFVIDSDDYDWGKENPQKIYNLGLEKLLFEITSIHIAKFLYFKKVSGSVKTQKFHSHSNSSNNPYPISKP